MKTQALENLFSAMLDMQIETGVEGTLSDERITQSLTTGPALSVEEKKVLLNSPIARYAVVDAKNKVSADIKARISKQHIETTLLPLAASDKSDKYVFSNSAYRVTLYDKQRHGIPWVILVQFDSAFMKILNPMSVIRLVDSGGLEWLRGKPDKNGELTASWSDIETDLLERAKRFSLNIELV